jgi:hypothetical protein
MHENMFHEWNKEFMHENISPAWKHVPYLKMCCMHNNDAPTHTGGIDWLLLSAFARSFAGPASQSTHQRKREDLQFGFPSGIIR